MLKTLKSAQVGHIPYVLACHLQINEDPDSDPAYHFSADPYADPTFQFDADPDLRNTCCDLLQYLFLTLDNTLLLTGYRSVVLFQ